MRNISITLSDNNENLHMQTREHDISDISDGICIDFYIKKKAYKDRELLLIISSLSLKLTWLKAEHDKFYIDLLNLKNSFPKLFTGNCEWMIGSIEIKPDIDDIYDDESIKSVTFTATYDQIKNNKSKKIFLSHKGANKDLVREFYYLLKELGFDPWFDEVDMPAGTDPYRGILQGFKESCSVIFFITPEFVDDAFLHNEISYALREHTARRSDFKIITLLFKGEGSVKDLIVPELLEQYIWKTPKTQLEAVTEIIKALPLRLGEPLWKK